MLVDLSLFPGAASIARGFLAQLTFLTMDIRTVVRICERKSQYWFGELLGRAVVTV